MEELVAADPPTEQEARQVLDYLRRKAKPRSYADENLPSIATTILRRRGADVSTVQESRRQGHPDENHATEALRLGRVLLTWDRDFLDERRFPLIHCPAIDVCDFGRSSAREISDTFNCLTCIFRGPQLYDKWVKIDAKRDGWTESIRHLDGTTSRHKHRVYGGRIQEWSEDTVCA